MSLSILVDGDTGATLEAMPDPVGEASLCFWREETKTEASFGKALS